MENEILDKISKYLSNKVVFAYVFGSILKENEFTPESDVDIGIYTDVATPLYELKEEIESFIFRDVDIVRLDLNDPIISMQIISNGKLLFTNNQKKEIEFRAQLYSRYIDFKNSRKEIEANLSKGMSRYVRK